MPLTNAADVPSAKVTGTAEWTTMPRFSIVREVGAAFSVAIRWIVARPASCGDIAARSAWENRSIPVFGWPRSARVMIGQSYLIAPGARDANGRLDAMTRCPASTRYRKSAPVLPASRASSISSDASCFALP
ncbi:MULTISPECIES: hypothetical protein [unclassified Sphingomonas]|uniref:hypothetical protein n=1 Tax=unclassified Sphingomonas TaxID=196159 RepID=UPI0025798FD5|nr:MULTISPECIES: hypothetical protein [unclassified Sphingomonas]